MRIIKSIAILALALAPRAAYAQTTDTPATTRGFFDLGMRATDTKGEPARYERFRDLKDGLFFETFRLDAERNGWQIKVGADHALRTDQRYMASFVKGGTFKAIGSWDQIPFLMSQTTKTPYLETIPGVFIIDDNQQKAWFALSTTAPAGGFAPRYVAFLSAVNNSPKFDLSQKRHTGAGTVEYLLNENVTFKVNAKRATRKGAMPYGAYLGTEIELPQPINQTMSDVDASVEATRGIAIFRVGYTGSWFTNHADPVIFDNPANLTDLATASGRGRLPRLALDSTRLGVNGMVSLKIPRRSRLTAYVTMATLKDGGEAMLPFTINSAVTQPALFRSTLDGKAVTTSATVTFSSRPSPLLNFVAKYRYFDYDNQTAPWTNTSHVRYDNSYQLLTTPFVTEAFSVKRNTLDADVYLTPKGRATFSVGGSRYSETRNDRIYTGHTENIMRAKVDVIGQSFLTLRSIYEYSQRRGEGYDENVLVTAAEQRLMRHFDVADRNRNRMSLVASLMPNANWGLNLSAATGKDDYLNTTIGLRDNDNTVYSAGVVGTPSEQFALGVSYSYENYKSKQMNNRANAATGTADLSQYFSTAGDDKVHSVIANADITKIADKVDLHFTYDFNQSRVTYVFGTGDPVPSTLAAPVQLPTIRSDLTRGTVDGVYHVTERIAVGLTYWYDKYAVTDFTLDSQAQEARVPGNYMLLGYAFQPYTAQTVWGRLMVKW